MADPLKSSTGLPEPERHLEHVGQIAAAWSSLEFYIDSTIWRLGGIKPEIGACITSNLGSIHMRLRSLRALAELHGASKQLLKDITAYQGKVSGTAEKRNRAIHDPWITVVSVGNVGPDGFAAAEAGQLVIRADSKGREFKAKPIPNSYLLEVFREINKRTTEFFKLRTRFSAELLSFEKQSSRPPEEPHPTDR